LEEIDMAQTKKLKIIASTPDINSKLKEKLPNF